MLWISILTVNFAICLSEATHSTGDGFLSKKKKKRTGDGFGLLDVGSKLPRPLWIDWCSAAGSDKAAFLGPTWQWLRAQKETWQLWPVVITDTAARDHDRTTAHSQMAQCSVGACKRRVQSPNACSVSHGVIKWLPCNRVNFCKEKISSLSSVVQNVSKKHEKLHLVCTLFDHLVKLWHELEATSSLAELKSSPDRA